MSWYLKNMSLPAKYMSCELKIWVDIKNMSLPAKYMSCYLKVWVDIKKIWVYQLNIWVVS